ncbi:MFS transporter [Streptomyces sp. NPDC057702]|uniref:MFS transporter n=1 Tax=unclassified Streptomyces TaxID=2593676 RepID=UPI0036BE3064
MPQHDLTDGAAARDRRTEPSPNELDPPSPTATESTTAHRSDRVVAAEPPTPPPPTAGSIFQAPYTAMTWGIVLSVSLVAFESMGVATVLPEIAGKLGGLNAYGWGLSTLMLANLIGTVAAGRAADRRGPARPLGTGLVVFAVGCALTGAATNWPVFLVGRFVQGLGVGAVMALAYTAISLVYPERLRARMFALVSGGWTVPSLVGPAIAALVAEHVHWRGVFVLLLPLIVVAWMMAVPPLARFSRTSPVPVADGARVPWWRGPVALGVLVSASTAVLLVGLERTDPALLVPLVLVGAVGAVVGLRSVMPAGTLTVRRGVPTGVVLRFLLCGAYFGSEAFLPLGLTRLRGLSATEAGLGLSAGAITWVVGAAWQGRADSRWSGRSRAVPISVGFAVLAVGIAVIAAGILVDAVPPLVAVVGWAIGGAGMGVAFNAATTDAMEQAPAVRQGEASGSMQLAQTLATAGLSGVGGAAIALAHAHGGTTSTALAVTFALTAALAVTGVATAYRIRPRAQ